MNKSRSTRSIFDQYVSEKVNRVRGISVIDHRIRTKIEITVGEYCILELYWRRMLQNKQTTWDDIYTHTGIIRDQAGPMIKRLLDKELLKPVLMDGSKRYVPSEKFLDLTEKLEEADFETFWRMSNGRKWPGSKKDARKKFAIAAKEYGAQHLIKCKRDYFEYLSLPENDYRNTMQASVFLNISTERFNENWREQYNDIIAERKKKSIPDNKIIKTSTMTKKEKDELFK